MKYSEIFKKNKELEKLDSDEYKISILSNIMVHQAKEICEYLLRSESINANVYLGNYDNILQDSLKFQNSNAIIIFWEIYNLIDGLEYKIEFFNDKEFNELVNRVKTEIDIVFNNLKDVPLLIMNKFSTIIFQQDNLDTTKLDKLAMILNKHVENKKLTNLKIVNINRVIAKLSIQNSINLRFYYSSKTLYSIRFYKEYFNFIKPIFLSVNAKVKKALIFDCDNTLWGGILGEDGFDNINIFKEIQYFAVTLAKRGVIIGLCSKNNFEDVEEVLEKHKDMILKNQYIIIKKINWNNKVSNIKAIAKELNIGLDSLVFVDDSSFEVELIRKELPMVKVFQVPDKRHQHFIMMSKVSNLFYNFFQTKEDLEKIQMYKTQILRTIEEQKIGNIDDYLKLLKLEIQLFIDDISQVGRIFQMTQKTNQFNLTTKRYTQKDIEKFIYEKTKFVVTIKVNDKFGDYGIVGLSILEIVDKNIKIDTLLMSCRILGRNIEYKFMDSIIDFVKNKGFKIVYATYIPNQKNKQVENLFNSYKFDILEKNKNFTKYKIKVDDYTYTNIDYIKVLNGK